MKKVLSILVTIMLVAAISVGCREKGTKATVVIPEGAPSLAAAYMMKTDDSYNYSIEAGANIKAIMTKGDVSYVIAPTNVGYTLAQSNGKYKLAATTSWGNLYLISTDSSLTPLQDCESPTQFLNQFSGKSIDCIEVESVPGKTFKHLLDTLAVSVTVNGNTAPNIKAGLDNGTISTAILGEPAITSTINLTGAVRLCSISELWYQIKGQDFPQASVFVKSTLSDGEVQTFLNKLENSINYLNQSEQNATELGNFMKDKISLAGVDLKDCYLQMNQRFVLAKDVKNDIISFVGVLGVNYNANVNVFYEKND